MPRGARFALLFGLIVAYLAGAPAVLVWSLKRWRRGERSAYFLPLLIPVAALLVLPLLNIGVDLLDREEPNLNEPTQVSTT